MNANLLLCLVNLGLAASSQAQQSLPADFRLSGREVTAAFESQRAVLQTSSAVILDGRREISYAVVVSADGYLLAKASEVAKAKKLAVMVDATMFPSVSQLAEDPTWDVVLLRIPASGLIPVRFSNAGEPPQGTWVVSNGATTRSQRRALAGIISANPREIAASDGVALGISFKDGSSLKISGLAESGGAKAAGLQEGDVVVELDHQKVSTIEDLGKLLKERKAGERVSLTYSRDGKEASVDVLLGSKAELFSNDGMMDRNDMMSGEVSKRRSGFPRIIQHDTLSSARIVGGPLLNLDGECIGMNIARANRCENFAIPAAELRGLLDSLLKKSDQAPARKAE